MAAVTTVREYCRQLLEAGSLEAKLSPPCAADGGALVDEEPGAALVIDVPARDAHLRLHSGSERLPKLHELKDRRARAVTLERFAHHELCAVELFAWALLAFPELPKALRRGLLGALAEEQLHLRLYLERLSALEGALGEGPHSDYLWRGIRGVLTSAHPEAAFLAAVGLTFEQANLDYTALYTEAFTRAGDDETAAVLQRVHEDEIGHVALAARWLPRLLGDAASDVEAYERAVPFPCSAHRAKARRFCEGARRRAGLSEAFIRHVEHARPTHQTRP